MKLYNILVRRDAHTTNMVTAPEHELPILQTIFGEENVQTLRREPLGGDDPVELTEADVAGEGNFDSGEFDRLARKYGGDDEGLFVEQVYGKKANRGLESRMSANEKKEAKFAKPKTEADTPEGKPGKGASKPKAEADNGTKDPAGADGK